MRLRPRDLLRTSGGASGSRGAAPPDLCECVFLQSLPRVLAALAAGVNPNAPDESGDAPLLLAANRHKKVLILQVLLAAGADPRQTDVHGVTALHWLARRRDDAEVLRPFAEELLRAGADLEARESLYGAAPLAWSGWHGTAGAAKVLLSLGAQPDADDAYQGTAAHWAAMNHPKSEAAALLIDAQLHANGPNRPKPLQPEPDYRRKLQIRLGPTVELDARVAAAIAVALIARACERYTGISLPGPVRLTLARLVMKDKFTLWEPTLLPVI